MVLYRCCRGRCEVSTIDLKGLFTYIACHSHAAPMPFPCHAVPLRVQNVSFSFDLHSAAVSDSHLPCHAPTVPFFSRPQHSMTVLCCGLEKNGIIGAWHGHSMASVNQTRQHCVNQMGKTHSKPLAVRHGRGTAWARHGNGMLCVNRP